MISAAQQYVAGLHRSFAVAYALLERPKIARRAIVLLLAIHTGLLAYSAYVHSPTLNEPGHLVAGLSYWKFGQFDVYNVNPPLVKMVAALPVMAVGYEEDWSGFYTGLGARPEFAMGEDFVAANGERSFFLFMIARWACIPFSWLGGIICYLWARDLFGRPSGVVACAIWCFEPNILAHASLITSDAAGTALGLAACYTFWRWLKQPTWSQAALTGIVLGLAELTKTTLILFYPLWPLMWLGFRWSDRHAMALRDWFREAGMLAARMVIGLYVLNLGYGFEDSLQPLGEFRFISSLFTGGGPETWNYQHQVANSPAPSHRPPDTPNHNRFANSLLACIPVPFPRQYLLGIDIQQSDFEDTNRQSYLRGKWRTGGWWYYYIYAVSIKLPLGLLTIAMLATVSCCIAFRDLENDTSLGLLGHAANASARLQSPSHRDILILLSPPLLIFAVVSSKTGLNEHMRYILPCFPFVFVWISGFVGRVVVHGCRVRSCDFFGLVKARGGFAIALLIWAFTSSLSIFPHSIAFCNEAILGPRNARKHLLGSNVDWGQDTAYVINWSVSAAQHRPVFLLHRACYDPIAVLGATPCPWNAFSVREVAKEGQIIVSCSFLEGGDGTAYDGTGKKRFVRSSAFPWLHDTEPVGYVGYTSLILGTPSSRFPPSLK